MDVEGEVARHYAQSELTRTVLDALRAAGKDLDALDAADLPPVDEFHTGWAPQTVEMAKTLDLAPGVAVLDVGSGIGGPARYFARTYGCDVTGIDLTPAFVELATDLTARTGLADRVRFVEGSALALPFEAGQLRPRDMIHVGMNIADKATALRRGAPGAAARRPLRRLRPDARRRGRAADADALGRHRGDQLRRDPRALPRAARRRRLQRDRRARLDRASCSPSPPRCGRGSSARGCRCSGVHLLLGPTGRERLGRVVAAIRDGLLAPTEIDAIAG